MEAPEPDAQSRVPLLAPRSEPPDVDDALGREFVYDLCSWYVEESRSVGICLDVAGQLVHAACRRWPPAGLPMKSFRLTKVTALLLLFISVCSPPPCWRFGPW